MKIIITTFLWGIICIGIGNLNAQCIVSDAGTSDVNGQYTWDCTTLNSDNNPVYVHEGGAYYLHANYDNLWVINEDEYYADQYDAYYYSDAGYDGSSHIPPTENWEAQNGSTPVPTITVSLSFTVSNAGDSYLNGVYTFDGTTNDDGNPVYKLEDEYYYLHANYDNVWVINQNEYYADQSDCYYYSETGGYEGNPNIPPADGWEQQNGASPSPEVGCNAAEPPCPTFDVSLTTQAEIDNFIITYPNCTHLQNALTINGSDITNLNGLGNLVSSLTFQIYSAPSLTSLSSLSNFEQTEVLTIEDTGISNLTGLTSITSLDFLSIQFNPNLTSLLGMSDLLPKVEIRLVIAGNQVLTSTNGLNPSSAINPNLNIHIDDNPLLEELGNLNNITTIERIWIQGNPALTDLSGLENLVSVTGSLSVSGETTLNGLDNLTSVGHIGLSNNTSVSDFSDLTSITTIGSFYLSNTSLTSLDGLDEVTFTNGFTIQDNSSLTDIDALTNAELNISSLTITGNSTLSSCALNNICDLLDDNTVTKTISNNATNCNSIAEIEAICNAFITIPTAPNTYNAVTVSTDANGYASYTDASGNTLIKIKAPAGITIPPSAVKLKVGATLSTYYDQYCGGSRNGGCFVRKSTGNVLINRFWDIDKTQVTGGTISSTTPIDLVLYFTQADFDALNTELTNNGQSPLSGFTDLQAYVVKNTAGLSLFPSPSDIGNYRKVYRLSNSSTASTTKWVLENPNAGIYSMEMKVIRIDNGGGFGLFF